MNTFDVIKNPQLREFFRDKGQFRGLTATAAAIPQNRLVEISSNKIQLGTDDDANIIGATQMGAISANGTGDIDFGVVDVLCSGDFSILDKLTGAADGRIRKNITAQGTLLAATAGGNFGNQPAGDTVQVLSSSTDDTTQTVTLYYTKTGATGTVTTEVLNLNGTTAVDTSVATVQTVLAVVVSGAHVGTITVQEKSGGADIITLATGTNTAGFHATTSAEAYGAIPTIKAGGASTKIAGVLGVGVDGDALSAVVTLNGTTDVNLGTVPFDTVTHVLIGDVASASTATVETKDADTNDIGLALEAGVSGSIAKVYVKPFGL